MEYRGVILLVTILTITIFHHAEGVYKMCAYQSLEADACKGLELGNSNVSCHRVPDSVGCSLSLKSGYAQFAVMNAEEAVLASKKVDDSLLVIGSIRPKNQAEEDNALEMVAVVRRSVTAGTFKYLRGKKYCHPGIGNSHHLTDRFLKSFENKVVPKVCNISFSAVEQEVYNVASFFGDSCRAGTWAEDDYLDNSLKYKYSKLCQLCDLQQDKCINNVDNKSKYEAALDCLTLKSGDITFVPLASVKRYMSLPEYGNFVFLCPNETVMELKTSKPCIWGTQPWDVIVTKREIARDLKINLMVWMDNSKKSSADAWQTKLKDILLGDSKVFKSIDVEVPLSNYIDRGIVDTDIYAPVCSSPLQWCTTKDVEQEKCHWLRVAAETYGVKPRIECVRANNLSTCLQYISANKADAVSINTDFGYIARQKYNLTTIVFEDNYITGYYKVLAVVKADINPGINRFQDLKDKKACFPEYNGLGWLSFVNLAKEKGLINKECPTRFFGDSSAPGANYEFLLPGEQPQRRLCKLATNDCRPAATRLERNINAMKCLDNDGDVAFINYEALLIDHKRINNSIITSNYKVLCRNGTIVKGTLDVDDNCALATGIRAEIVGRNTQWDPEIINYSELFLQLKHWFASVGGYKGAAMRMFDKFKGDNQLLFKDTTISLVQPQDSNYNYINSYKDLLSKVSKQCNAASTLWVSTITIIISFISLRWLN